ncbi:lytic transglycosylase domain-containing protein [Caldovatus aquaticus]|uniref:Lytic transglycosylase domain-containing protein n=1 Tax=Caldovatus aquaticus TaxID=2865671 RepID=A0ABS7F204_9PROT|nr:lytic transglycosylase domain-containing protein [Caldovatus aquaticus]MBW8269524.1 lytic transglycosylase domain-containing protein [Caldovatus aquaticus]
MPRRRRLRSALLAFAAGLLLATPAAAPCAQPWATEAQRLAGRQALAAAAAQRWLEADSLALAADPLARKIVTWMRLAARNAPATAAELVRFVEENPDWPFQEALARRAEEALAGEPDDALALRWLALPAAATVRTLDGAQRLADALARAGRAEAAARLLRAAWAEAALDGGGAEDAFLARNAPLLSAADHARRFERLLVGRNLAAAARQAGRLEGARRAAAEAALAFLSDRSDAEARAPAGAEGDLGLLYARARWLRRRDRDLEAAALWRSAGEAAQRGMEGATARAVWIERQVLARKLLRLGESRAAYEVAAGHGQTAPGEPRQEAEFLAGFIALRRLGDAGLAARHFAAVDDDSRSAITRARSAYWEGRAHAARGDETLARARYAAAAAFPTAYYGQLAALALGEDTARIAARLAALPVPAVGAERAHAFAAKELARAAATLADLGEARRALPFLLRLRETAADPAEQALAARLALALGRPDHAVWVARRAGADGVVLLPEGWPTPYAPPVASPEPAVIHAIARQESNFDPEAVSSSNARGLMQLLPGTAAQVARRLGVAHALPMLTADPLHNMRLGAAYLDEMLARFDGALPLAAAAYNAGPRRVEEWLAAFGDPRAGAVNMLDWIELIPFSETRNYVQRVIENVVVYRARDPATAALEHPLARWLGNGP